jgi:hypothetical protein
MNGEERRTSSRVQCFLVEEVKQQLPVWVFRPADEADAVLALVVDIAVSGIQVLIDPRRPVGPGYRKIHLLPVEEIGFRGAYLSVQFLWQHVEGRFSRAGFTVQRRDSPFVESLLHLIDSRASTASPLWLRCTLISSDGSSGIPKS